MTHDPRRPSAFAVENEREEAPASPNSFDKQFPGYDLIPEKKNRWAWPLAWLGFASLLAFGTYSLMNLNYVVPVPNMAGTNKLTLGTLREAALMQAQGGDVGGAISHLQRYFALGGTEADMMTLYADSLSRVGREAEALNWARKATDADPKSRAARVLRDTLEKK